jgi:flagellin
LVGGDDPADVTKAILTLGDNADFSVAITDATDAEGTLEELQAAINNVSGYENVTLKFEGDVITITDPSAREITISLTDDDDAEIVGSAVIDAGEPSGGELSALTAENIKTRTAANSAIEALDDALIFVNEERAVMGATINRLTYATDNLSQVAMNASESRSRILDADYAQTTTELARTQIIQQAATAMLAQANQAPQSVLSLLR